MRYFAYIHPVRAGGRSGYLYDVTYGGEPLVNRSKDPEFDACRELQARGLSGKLTLLDDKNDRPRVTVDIQKGAAMATREDRHRGPIFKKWREFEL